MSRESFDPERAKGAERSMGNGDGGVIDILTEGVIGAAIEVHRTLGPGFLESMYEHAMSIELRLRGIEHRRQAPVSVKYKGHDIGEGRIDLLVDNRLITELKTVESFANIYTAQAISCLKATKLKTALLINFNVPVLKEGLKRVSL